MVAVAETVMVAVVAVVAVALLVRIRTNHAVNSVESNCIRSSKKKRNTMYTVQIIRVTYFHLLPQFVSFYIFSPHNCLKQYLLRLE